MPPQHPEFLVVARPASASALGEVFDRVGCGHAPFEALDRVLPLLEEGGVAGVLVDSGFEEGGAIELVRALNLLASRYGVPVLYLHGEDEYELMEQALECGASDSLLRPMDEAQLTHRLRVLQTRSAGGHSASPEPDALPTPPAARTLVSRRELTAAVERSLGSATQEASCALFTISIELSPEAKAPECTEDLEEFLGQIVPSELFRAIEEFARQGDPRFDAAQAHVARISRTRYGVLLPRVARLQATAKLGALMQENLARPYLVHGAPARRAVHIGVASCPQDATSASKLFEASETACYCARQDGCDSLHFYTASMSRWAFERLTLERSLAAALEEKQLEVFYQPRVSLDTRSPLGFEALLRWRHPELGLVSPAQFIPLAEETGLIIPIGKWVLQEACRQNRRWQELGLPRVRMSVNLSAVQFREPTLFDDVRNVLADTGLDPDDLELEVTESMLMQDAKSTIETLRSLKDSGIHLSIDDFGTGYSSLSYLKRFPIDALKIDRSFIREVNTNPDDAAIATSIILMGHSLRLTVVAEGVEEESQLSFLRVLGCDEAQGYLFSPPTPPEGAEDYLRRAKNVGSRSAA